MDDDINNVTEEADISMNDISKEEIKEGLRVLANNKAAGLDFIPVELLKWGGDAMVDELTKIANVIWHTAKVPEEWKCGAIVKLPKKGNMCDCYHWRGITHLIIARKMLCRVLLKLLQKNIDAKLREKQAGFRHGRSSNEHIFPLRNTIEQSLEYCKPLIINYVDFKKALDSIYRPTLWKILKIYGIPQKYIDSIYCPILCKILKIYGIPQKYIDSIYRPTLWEILKLYGIQQKCIDSIYCLTLWKILKIYGIPQKYIDVFQELCTNSRCCVKTGSGTTDYFKVETGVQQGDISSPYFFLAVMDCIIAKAMSPSHFGIIWQETQLTDLDFADDLALLTNDCEQMQLMTD